MTLLVAATASHLNAASSVFLLKASATWLVRPSLYSSTISIKLKRSKIPYKFTAYIKNAFMPICAYRNQSFRSSKEFPDLQLISRFTFPYLLSKILPERKETTLPSPGFKICNCTPEISIINFCINNIYSSLHAVKIGTSM